MEKSHEDMVEEIKVNTKIKIWKILDDTYCEYFESNEEVADEIVKTIFANYENLK